MFPKKKIRKKIFFKLKIYTEKKLSVKNFTGKKIFVKIKNFTKKNFIRKKFYRKKI